MVPVIFHRPPAFLTTNVFPSAARPAKKMLAGTRTSPAETRLRLPTCTIAPPTATWLPSPSLTDLKESTHFTFTGRSFSASATSSLTAAESARRGPRAPVGSPARSSVKRTMYTVGFRRALDPPLLRRQIALTARA